MKTFRIGGPLILALMSSCSLPKAVAPPAYNPTPPDCIPSLDPGSTFGYIPKSWLSKQLTIAEAEIQNTVVLPGKDKRPIPFGGAHKQWLSLKQAYQPGDELWFYASPDIAGQMKTGTDGYVLLRDGKIVHRLVTIVWN